MLRHKSIEKICGIVACICILIAVIFMNSESLGITQAESTNTYTDKLFSELAVHEIDIIVDDDEWNTMLDNASDKEYMTCDLYIDGERFTNIGIRTKGNSSLQQVQSSDSDRYSFKIEFDHYDSTTTYYGLDKFCLNNIVQDNTYMKDYLAYDLMNQFGVASPLTNYVNVSVNGELFGFYLAVEAIEESFLQRNYGNNYGVLYKPETSSNIGGGGGGDRAVTTTEPAGDMPQGGPGGGGMPQGGDMAQGGGMPQGAGMARGGGGMPQGGGMIQGDAVSDNSTDSGESTVSTISSSLNYIDDDVDNYSYIFDNAVSNISNTDKSRLIDSIQQMNEQEDLEEVVDVEQVIRYFIVHNFLLNFDSYTGSIMHNYYMYEEDGVLSMLPWDYNLSFVAFMTSYNTEQLINFPIDTPVSTGTVEGRPMLAWIFANEEYTELYHQLFEEFIVELFDSGYVSNTISEVKTLIVDYVENDPSKFCTYEEFLLGIDTLDAFIELRVESIKGQLDGTIGSTTEEQLSNPNLISAGNVEVTNTGTNQVQTHGSVGMSPTRNNRQQASGGQGEAMQQQAPGGMGADSQMQRQAPDMVVDTVADSSHDMLLLASCFIVMIIGIFAVTYFKRRRN